MPAAPLAASCWQLALASWVGTLWLLHFLLLPAIAQVGLAPMLVEEIRGVLMPLLLLFAALALVVQVCVLVFAAGFSSLWRDMRGLLLIAALVLVAISFGLRGLDVEAPRWQVFNYLMVALCGLLLTLQPSPGSSAVVKQH